MAPLCALLALGASPLLRGAVSNVIVWTSARTPSQLDTTLQNAPTSSTGMRLWWKCDSGANVGWDSTGQGLSYNCGNHLELYDSDFSYTGRALAFNSPPFGDPAVKLNYPAAGIDLEPMGRYMREHTTVIENCTMFDNRENGLLLTAAKPSIIRDCTIWQSTGGRAVYVLSAQDVDHFFIR